MTDDARHTIRLADAIRAVGDEPYIPASVMSMTDEQWAEHDARVAASIEAERTAQSADRQRGKRAGLSKAGFPARALEAARVADESKSAIVRVKSWEPEDESVLVLSGSPGCGKTVAAAWWAMRRNQPPAFVRATTFAASSRYDRETRAAWFSAEAMVLDDLGTEYLDAKGSFLVDLDELLDVFYGDRKPLLITTNCTTTVFRERYGARVVDRIRECGSWFSTKDTSLRSDSRSK